MTETDTGTIPATGEFTPGTPIPYFEEGSPRTLLSASEANRLIAIYNAVCNMRVGSGLRLTWSGNVPVIELALEDLPVA